MVFSSSPLYLDSHNWQQQQISHQQVGGGSSGNHDQYPVLPAPPPSMGGGAGSTSSIRPVSMVDRARLANLPQPEPGLKCPRCESTNTKFCYFNNYNLAQPRHFCKTCRRYWTRGGALRSVPVGGGCRRNKRSTKNNNNNGTTAKSTSLTSSTSTEVIPTHFSQMPIMPSSQNLGNTTMSTTPQFGASRNNLGLNFGGVQQECDLGFIQLGSNNNNINSSPAILSNSQWRNPQHVQHFPFLTTSFEPNAAAANTSFYQLFQNEDQNVVENNAASSNALNQSSIMKMEDQSPLGLNLTKSLLGGGSENNMSQYWGNGGNAWNDFSGTGLNSSSSNNLL